MFICHSEMSTGFKKLLGKIIKEEKMKFIQPTIEYKKTFENFINVFESVSSIDGSWFWWEFVNAATTIQLLQDYAVWKNLPDWYVPASTYWLIKDETMIGTLNLRHELSKFLLQQWWHIGYAIYPDYRKKWYWKEILRLGLIEAQKIWIKKVLLTCNEDNTWSEKVIRANGWKYEDTRNGKKRFWIMS